MARFALYGMITLAVLTALWVGLRRIAWDEIYKTVGLIVPAQELDGSLSDRELREYLHKLQAHGVVAVSIELTDFPHWGLQRTSFDHDLWRVVQLARAVGLEVAIVDDVHIAELPAELRPKFIVLISDPPGEPIQIADLPSNTLVGIIEFSEPSGLQELYRHGWRNLVRVHAIRSQELDRLSLEGALARWERAVHERTIRLLWVTEHQRFPQYLERLSLRITKLGMELGAPSAPAPFESFSWVYLAIGAGFVSLALLVLMGRLSLTVLLGCGVGGVSALVLVGMWDVELARQALALLIATVVPWLLLWVSTERFSGWKLLVIVSLGSMAAGLAAAAVLSDLSYFLKINEFRGVKLALVAPSVLIVLVELSRWRGLGWRYLFAKRGAWLIPALGLGMLFFVLERSGNLPAVPVARWEELLRERLEDWLIARPRFKEFLVGHPALMLWGREPSLVHLGLLALGALGQASIINTFVHLHTPLTLSLWRTINGLVLGLLIGLMARFVFERIQQWRRL